MKKKAAIYTCLTIFFFIEVILAVNAQQILNGSFEMNDLDCGINMMNDDFTNHVQEVTAFGGQSEIDLLSPLCNFDQSVEGEYFVALYNFTFSDAISFNLTSPLLAGKLYNLRFAGRLGEGFSNNNSAVQIGLSNIADEFGTPIYSSTFLGTTWQYFQFQFSPTATSDYITVRIFSNDESWVFLDDFSLNCPTIDLGNDTAYCIVENITLQVDDYFENYQWSDHSKETSLEINEPGKYWVTAIDGNCIISDTIQIEEIDFNCACQIYFPNIFSPNDDGINDAFYPLSPCEMLDYQLTIFDRWGQIVFRSSEENLKWDGTKAGRKLGSGVFTYLLEYRFIYQTEISHASGDISLLR